MGGDATAPRRRLHRIVLATVGILASAWLAIAYLLLPVAWSHHEHQPGLAAKPMLTFTKQGIHGDPINVGLVGSKTEIIRAMAAAGWQPADAITMLSSFRIGTSVVLNHAYPSAPISNLFYEGKPQALGFERADGKSAKRRHHVRFWPSLDVGKEGRPVWLGSASFDRGVGLSHYTFQITHRVAPDVDAERDLLMADLTRAKMLATTYHVAGIGPTTNGRNGGGDPYFTDGDVTMGVLTKDDMLKQGAPEQLPDSASVATKNGIWHSLHWVGQALHLVPQTPEAAPTP